MKKLFAVLLALGLIVAFSATASAANVKFGGSYYLVGVYDDNPSLADNTNYSRAYFYQRLRIQPVFEIAKGLTFTARFDALEKQWGNVDWKAGTDEPYSRRQTPSAGNPKIQENIEWERGYVTFTTGIGKFDVGYMSGGAWGTVFADSEVTRPRIKYSTKAGPLTLMAVYEKKIEANKNAAFVANYGSDHLTDADYDAYYLIGIYGFKGGSAGLLYGYLPNHTSRPAGKSAGLNLLEPYMKATFGPVYVEAELDWFFGKAVEYEAPLTGPDKDYDSWAAYVLASVNFGPAKIGAQFGWCKGDNNPNDDKIENAIGGGWDWNPALILMNDNLATWSGGDVNTSNSGKNNLLLFNIFADYKVTPTFSLGSALTYAKADKVPDGVDDDYGMELDVTATYKIFDNLSYMLGAGYLWTGDYYKAATGGPVDNDYILMNKLSLTF